MEETQRIVELSSKDVLVQEQLSIAVDQVNGLSAHQITEKYGIQGNTYARYDYTQDKQAQEFKKQAVAEMISLGRLAFQKAADKVLAGKGTIQELAIIGGVALQRALEVDKTIGSSPEIDWSKVNEGL